MLRWRLLLGAALIAALVGLCWLDHRAAVHGAWLALAVVPLAVLATGEVLDFARAAGMRPVAWIVYATNLLVLAANWVPVGTSSAATEQVSHLRALLPDWPMLMIAVGLLAAFVAEMRRYEKPGGVTANLAAVAFAVLYVGLLFSYTVQLRLNWDIGALASLIVVVKMGDTGAYTVGRLIGRHKMAPAISPGKTWEGAAGAIAFSLAGSWLAFQWLIPAMGAHQPASQRPVPSWGWIMFGILVGIAGMLGDLAESLLKRDVARKDSSSWLPGFGGVLDILDSVLLASPVAWACWALGLVGN